MVTPQDGDRSPARPRIANPAKRLAKGTAVAALAAVVVFASTALGAAREPAARADAASPASFDPALVATGASLAAVGDCIGCHTAPDGKPYAGGRALQTPFGTVYGSNITPDPDTGIGRWSEA
ncbi:MAG TPA: hypothetical protein VGI14_15890, partial [Casimicrobiaceae bacterium]